MLRFDVRAAFRDDATTFDVAADLAVRDGETLCLLGPSGSGKTLLLELLAGFHDHAGRLELDGRSLDGVPPEERGFGFVFQQYALFEHRSVRENVAFGAKYHEDARDPDALLARLGVADLAERFPGTLSGGEKQRVALARALCVRPDVFLLDEPLSALDAPTRERLRDDLVDVLADETAVYVTHDRTTARAVADRVAVLRDGRVAQVGPVADVFERPATRFVAAFTGATVVESAALPAGLDAPAGTLAVRPEHVRIGVDAPDGVPARVTRAVREDAAHRVTLAVGDAELVAYAPNDPPEETTVAVPSERWHAIPDGGRDADA
ncbi:ABC-type Fe3+/spermidine/putrescine transport system ATPase subunit [Halarchaeum rubridurum]|uniref:Molybdate/tungstate import ATP-binding protein WtpC n=1 Tax=Halarchaeum rubridurum TaxID=489911 RepID=A0A830FPH2_9EURY|nr:ABC transporter ATP-binding protein [Halarchaeum rubridurum]MBP1954161.1 ABC-type Fe3+/spermidine/putrescine transport system ATPase subunit [Halarchaeum rubridurum]GGM57809.1 spermidine/putrescine ABC transporter ATP-binding protein [Halarchaeum rubridurum]